MSKSLSFDQLIAKITPASLKKYGATGRLLKIDREKKVIHMQQNWPREARHPDEYGQRGEIAEQKMAEFDAWFDKEIQQPLEEMGYTFDIYAL